MEVRIESGNGGRERVVRIPRAARVALVVGGIALLVVLVVAAAVGPRALGALRVRREYDTQLGRRTQLGERLRALVDGLMEVERQSQDLERRVGRYETVYGLARAAADRSPEPRPPGEPAGTIFAGAIAHGERLAASVEIRLAKIDAALTTLAAWEEGHPAEVRALPLGTPLEGDASVETSGFGVRRATLGGELEFHAGLDLAAPVGTGILAPADGLVLWAGEPPTRAGSAWWRLGRTVVVRHDERFLTLYGHCDRIDVRRGRRVRRGDRLGTVGESGWTAAPHLHYEIRRLETDGTWTPIDPRLLLDASPGASPEPPGAGAGLVAPPPLPSAYRR